MPAQLSTPDTAWRAAVGRALRRRREALCLSREAFCNKVGYSLTHHTKIERGAEMSMGALVLTCQALDCKPSEIFADAGM